MALVAEGRRRLAPLLLGGVTAMDCMPGNPSVSPSSSESELSLNSSWVSPMLRCYIQMRDMYDGKEDVSKPDWENQIHPKTSFSCHFPEDWQRLELVSQWGATTLFAPLDRQRLELVSRWGAATSFAPWVQILMLPEVGDSQIQVVSSDIVSLRVPSSKTSNSRI